MRFALALIAIVLAAASPAKADTQSEAMLRDFVAWVDSSPLWSASVSLVRSEGDDTYADGLVFTREDPHLTISIEELRLRDLSARSGGGFTASEIEMRAGQIVTDKSDTRIPSLSASGASMPSLVGVTVDPKHVMGSLARFYAIAADGALDALTVPEINVVQQQSDSGGAGRTVQISYRNLSLAYLSGGVLTHQEVGPISVISRGPDAFDFTIDKVEVDRTDLGALAHILNESEYRDGHGDNVWRPLLSRAAYKGLSAHGPDGTSVRIDEVAVENVDGRQPEEPFTGTFDQIMDPATPEDAKNDLALEALSGMFRAFRVGTMRLQGLSVMAPKDGTSVSLDGFTFTGWSSDGIDSFLMKGLSANGPDVYASLGSMELAGFVSPDIRALMRFGALEKDIDIEKHAAAIRESFAALPRFSHFGMEDLALGQSKDAAVAIDRVGIDFSDWNEIFAKATDIRVENLQVPRALVEMEPQASAMLDALGYDGDLSLGISLSDRWDPDVGTDAGSWAVSVANAGDVALNYTLTGLTMDWLDRATAEAAKGADSEAAISAMLRDLGLARATLTVTDHSLLDRAFGVIAKRQGLTVAGAAYRQQMRAALPFLISAVIPAELARRIAPPLQGFMAGGQTLFANVTPPTPLPLLDLATAARDPLTLPDKLNLELKSEATKE